MRAIWVMVGLGQMAVHKGGNVRASFSGSWVTQQASKDPRGTTGLIPVRGPWGIRQTLRVGYLACHGRDENLTDHVTPTKDA
jgi:hypothetical protein